LIRIELEDKIRYRTFGTDYNTILPAVIQCIYLLSIISQIQSLRLVFVFMFIKIIYYGTFWCTLQFVCMSYDLRYKYTVIRLIYSYYLWLRPNLLQLWLPTYYQIQPITDRLYHTVKYLPKCSNLS